MRFSLATLVLDGEYVGAIELAGQYWPLAALRKAGATVRSTSIKGLLENWAEALPELEVIVRNCASGHYDPSIAVPGEAARLDVAVRFPNKLIAIGANYASHLAEMGFRPQKFEPMPFFLKAPTTAMVGPGRTVRMPRDTRQFDWEVELAVVVGARLSDAHASEVMAAIAGYSIGIDLSARDLVAPKDQPNDFARGKSQDTMAPFGPALIPAKFVDDPHNLRMTLDVNSRRHQDGSTSEMIYRIEEQLSIVSRFITLEPGDVILTGTPAGSGKSHGVFLKPGDKITAAIEAIGKLDVQVMGE
jgi:2-keto-4-pentenoate hydratase/2-oxohepta-3-ene-1,7-dioic acid hydratase in catechol pathway